MRLQERERAPKKWQRCTSTEKKLLCDLLVSFFVFFLPTARNPCRTVPMNMSVKPFEYLAVGCTSGNVLKICFCNPCFCLLLYCCSVGLCFLEIIHFHSPVLYFLAELLSTFHLYCVYSCLWISCPKDSFKACKYISTSYSSTFIGLHKQVYCPENTTNKVVFKIF